VVDRTEDEERQTLNQHQAPRPVAHNPDCNLGAPGSRAGVRFAFASEAGADALAR